MNDEDHEEEEQYLNIESFPRLILMYHYPRNKYTNIKMKGLEKISPGGTLGARVSPWLKIFSSGGYPPWKIPGYASGLVILSDGFRTVGM
jgi:hypothetical protein